MSEHSSANPGAVRNLLFGVLALQADHLDPDRFAEACALWCTRKGTHLADLLVERGWLTSEDRLRVDCLLDRKLSEHGGDAAAGLAEVIADRVRLSPATVTDPDVCRSVAATLIPPEGADLSVPRHIPPRHIPQGRNRYRFSRLHAAGGMGRVWLACDDALGRDVALKELLPELAQSAAIKARFLREARVAGQLEHPGVVPVYDVGQSADGGSPYYTMRFVRGRTLAEVAEQHHRKRASGEAGRLDLRELLTAFTGVCNAVAYAHSRGVLHRDLKPQNVILGDYGEVILLDWGLARLVDAPEASSDRVPAPVEGGTGLAATMHGQLLGTPAYMAPEQAEGRVDQLGARTDVYGLGAILYQILTARPPFPGDDATAILRLVVRDEPERPHRTVPDTPRALEAVCLKALAKNPLDRYATAKEMARDVQRWLADEPVSAWREPLRARAGRWVRKHRAGVAAGLVALLVAASGLLAVAAIQVEAGRRLSAKNRELEQANGRLEAARDRAERRVDLALGAVDNFLAAVNGNLDVQNKPENEALRKTLLKAPLSFYQELRDEFRDARDGEERARDKLANAYFQLAGLNRDLGSRADALQAYDEAVTLLDALVRESPEPATRYRLARALQGRGDEQSVNQETAAAALDSYLRARELFEAGLRDDPEAIEPLLALAATLISAADLRSRVGEPDKGLADLRRSVSVLEAARRRAPDRRDVQIRLAAAQRETADILGMNKGQLPEAFAATRAALDIAEPLARKYPDDSLCQETLFRIYQSLAQLHSDSGGPDKALECADRMLAIADALVRARPTASRHRLDRVSALARRGFALTDLGRHAESLAAQEVSRDGALVLVREQPTILPYKDALSTALSGMASAQFGLGRPADALKSVETQAGVLEEVVRLEPRDLYRQRNLAGVYYNCGVISKSLNRAAAAVKWYGRSLQVRERLAGEHPNEPRFEFDVASTVGNVGSIQDERQQFAEARASFERAVAILQKLSTAHPENADYRACLARTRINLGGVLSELGQTPEALNTVQETVVVFESMLGKHPDVAQTREDTATARGTLGDVLRKANRAAEALPEYRRAIDLREATLKASADNQSNRVALATTFRCRGIAEEEVGRPAEAVQDYRHGVDLCQAAADPQPDLLFEEGSCRGRLAAAASRRDSGLSNAEGVAEAEKAVATLRRAVAAGCNNALIELRTRKDFDALRPREDFQKLLREAEASEKSNGL
jgi:eukaryotic-like serine/threonine-protein kinase